MKCTLNSKISSKGIINMDEDKIPRSSNSRYFGSVSQQENDIDEYIIYRIRECVVEWRGDFEAFCNYRVSFKLKGKFHKIIIQSP